MEGAELRHTRNTPSKEGRHSEIQARLVTAQHGRHLPALGKAHQLVADRSTALSLEKVPLAPEEEAFAPWTSGSAHLNPAISFSPQVISTIACPAAACVWNDTKSAAVLFNSLLLQ